MRLVPLVAIIIAVATIAGPATSSRSAGVAVSIAHGPPTPEPAEVPEERPLGFRQWTTDFRIRVGVAGEPPCEPMRVSAIWRAVLNRRGTDYNKHPGNIVDMAGSVTIPTAAQAGERIELIAWAACHDGEGLRPVSKRVRVVVQVPLESCDQGPWKVLSVRGLAERQDDEEIRRVRWLRLRKDDALPGINALRTRQGGTLVFGDLSCNGLRLTLFDRSHADVGRYSKTGQGESTGVWGHARATLDRHAQGVNTDFLLFQPLGDRTATFDVRTSAQRLTSLDVLDGQVLIRSGRSKLAFLRAGDSITVRCTEQGTCRVERQGAR